MLVFHLKTLFVSQKSKTFRIIQLFGFRKSVQNAVKLNFRYYLTHKTIQSIFKIRLPCRQCSFKLYSMLKWSEKQNKKILYFITLPGKQWWTTFYRKTRNGIYIYHVVRQLLKRVLLYYSFFQFLALYHTKCSNKLRYRWRRSGPYRKSLDFGWLCFIYI